MALKLPIPFPIFAPAILSPNPAPATHRPPSELRFSRWNNANAERFNERRRTLQEIEDNIRRERRFDSADRISRYYDPDTPASAGESFKSTGTPSIPSRPSIPGKKSKYSRNPNRSSDSHPAFRSIRRVTRRGTRVGDRPPPPPEDRKAEVRVGDDGVSYVIDGAPFEFKYSYTETPKVKPVKLREAAFAPFGPTTMPRPWTGRAPLPASQKKLREFDSFRLPPPHKKGVKPVQAPGPYLAGSGPKHVMSREEIMGEPLTSEEVRELVESCKKTKRQMNMGRDGLTHNMLDNIHAHWKRRRVCKIKCKGVCTVDMENVYQQLEERTGGKIIFSQGGVLYLFRGRNYNYRSRPRFPLMLWKPITPVYPRLVKRVPEGMTLEEVAKMRNKGHKLVPICKLGKNGVYNNLVNMVREAFEECELVRINCQGMNGSDYRKIGAKLKDLVPCVLLSFAYEHILIWRGHDWKSALPKLDTLPEEDKESDTNNTTSIATSLEDQEVTTARITVDNETPEVGSGITAGHENEDSLSVEYVESFPTATEVLNSVTETEDMCVIQSPLEGSTVSDGSIYTTVEPQIDADVSTTDIRLENVNTLGGPSTEILGSNTMPPEVEIMETELDSVEEDVVTTENQQVTSEASQDVNQSDGLYSPCTEVVLSLLQQALESGSAMILDDADLDSDIVYQKTVTFSKSAPPGPVFKLRPRKRRVKISEVQENEKQDIEDSEDLEPQDTTTAYVREGNQKKGSKSKTRRKKDEGENIEFVVPHGSLRVDELAKLLA